MTFAEYGESRKVNPQVAYNYAMYLHREEFEDHCKKIGRVFDMDDEAVAMLDQHFAPNRKKKPADSVISTPVAKKDDLNSSKEKVDKLVSEARNYRENAKLQELEAEIKRLRKQNEELKKENIQLGQQVESTEDMLEDAEEMLDNAHEHLEVHKDLLNISGRKGTIDMMELKLAYAINNKDKESIHSLAVIMADLMGHMVKGDLFMNLNKFDPDEYTTPDDCDGDYC